MSDADRGAGVLVTGGYDATKLAEVDGARETDTGRVLTANFRKQYWNGGWTSSAGTGPEGETFCEKGEHEPVDFGFSRVMDVTIVSLNLCKFMRRCRR